MVNEFSCVAWSRKELYRFESFSVGIAAGDVDEDDIDRADAHQIEDLRGCNREADITGALKHLLGFLLRLLLFTSRHSKVEFVPFDPECCT